jgi:predicted NAD/FAD-binding protein
LETDERKLNIAVLGAGIAGITAAWLLAKRHRVTLFEREARLGGHTNTRTVSERDRDLEIDTGFIVCNPANYPRFYRLLDEWGVERQDSDMSFGFSCERTQLGYVGPSFREFMRCKSNLLKPVFWSFLRSQRRFNRIAVRELEAGLIGDRTLGRYLDDLGMSTFFTNNYLLPLAASVWSSPDQNMLQFPAESILRFFANHGLLRLGDFSVWQTIVGGSRTYLQRFRDSFPGRIALNAAITNVRRTEQGPVVTTKGNQPERFDQVVLAMHADQALAILDDATTMERTSLSTWQYHHNTTTLHTDVSVMPPDQRLWASWNYRRPVDAKPTDLVPITYHMNRLQNLDAHRDYFVSLNLREPIAPEHAIYEVQYAHPAYTPATFAAQKNLRALNGALATHFCGSYMGYGFHEDAVASACQVASRLGVEQ